MEIILLEDSPQLAELNEMFMTSLPSLPEDIEGSIYYTKLKQLLHQEIVQFCKEQIELKEDLNLFRMNVGKAMEEHEIRSYLDDLKEKYNNKEGNVLIDYHIEITRIDFGVPVFVIIKRGGKILMKKLVFRFKKTNLAKGISNLSVSQIPLDSLKKDGGIL